LQVAFDFVRFECGCEAVETSLRNLGINRTAQGKVFVASIEIP
jgi:hypothetical protein